MAARRVPLLCGAMVLVIIVVGVIPASANDDDVSRSFQESAGIAAAEKEPAKQQMLWNKFLQDSATFAHSHDDAGLWVWRAAAALALNRPREGQEAAATLTKLGLLESQELPMHKLAAALALEGWLRRGAAEAGPKGWSGKWVNQGDDASGKSHILDCLTIGSDRMGKLNVFAVEHFCYYYGKNHTAFLYNYPGPCLALDESGQQLWWAFGSISAVAWSDDHRSLTITTKDSRINPVYPARTFIYTLDADKNILKRDDGGVFRRE